MNCLPQTACLKWSWLEIPALGKHPCCAPSVRAVSTLPQLLLWVRRKAVIFYWCFRARFKQIWRACVRVWLWMPFLNTGGRFSITWKGLWSHTACLRALALIVLQIMSLWMNFPCFHLFQSSFYALLSPPFSLLFLLEWSTGFIPDPPTGHLYHCSSVVKTRSKIKPKLNVRSVSLYYVRLCIICYYMLLLFFKSGIDYSVKTLTLDNMQVAMQLWDTAGQERWVTPSFSIFQLTGWI